MNLFCISELPNINLLFKLSQHGSIFGIDYPTVRIPKLWSLEDLEIRNIKKLEAFKSALYSKLVDGYSKEVSCDNPFCEYCLSSHIMTCPVICFTVLLHMIFSHVISDITPWQKESLIGLCVYLSMCVCICPSVSVSQVSRQEIIFSITVYRSVHSTGL